MRVIWSPLALGDVGRIYDYVASFNPRAAVDLAQKLDLAARGLGDLPERGRPIAGRRRELLVIWPYVIRYRIKASVVEILRVRHGSRQPLK
jgi:plasmid stabilization system protein ParE